MILATGSPAACRPSSDRSSPARRILALLARPRRPAPAAGRHESRVDGGDVHGDVLRQLLVARSSSPPARRCACRAGTCRPPPAPPRAEAAHADVLADLRDQRATRLVDRLTARRAAPRATRRRFAGRCASAAFATPAANCWKSFSRATKSVSQFTSTTAARATVAGALDHDRRPSAAMRVAFLSAFARPALRISSAAASRSPLVSTSAFLHSIMPAPVRSRSTLHCFSCDGHDSLRPCLPQVRRAARPRRRAAAGRRRQRRRAPAGGRAARSACASRRGLTAAMNSSGATSASTSSTPAATTSSTGASGILRAARRRGACLLAHRRRTARGRQARRLFGFGLPSSSSSTNSSSPVGDLRQRRPAFEHRIGDAGGIQLDGAHGVVVARDHVVDVVRRAVGVDDRDDRDAELLGLVDRDRSRDRRRSTNSTSGSASMSLMPPRLRSSLSRSRRRPCASLAVLLERAGRQSSHRSSSRRLIEPRHGLEVREHAAEPAMADVRHAAARWLPADRLRAPSAWCRRTAPCRRRRRPGE